MIENVEEDLGVTEPIDVDDGGDIIGDARAVAPEELGTIGLAGEARTGRGGADSAVDVVDAVELEASLVTFEIETVVVFEAAAEATLAEVIGEEPGLAVGTDFIDFFILEQLIKRRDG